MYLIQIFLPLYDNAGAAFPRDMFEAIRTSLVERFGGLTEHARAPVRGLWKEEGDAPNNTQKEGDAATQENTIRDDLVIYEVMADDLDRQWWRTCREGLERQFRQQAIVIRAQPIYLL